MAVQNKPPLLAIGVEVQECFLHCSKAFKRSKLWNPESWERVETLPSAAKIVAEHAGFSTLESLNNPEGSKTQHLYEKAAIMRLLSFYHQKNIPPAMIRTGNKARSTPFFEAPMYSWSP